MFRTAHIAQVACDRDDVFAFRIAGEIVSDEAEQISAFMNDQFDRHDTVSMLLILDDFQGSETGARFDFETIKSRMRSLTNIDKYAVVGAPDGAAKAIELSGAIMPVETKTFAATEEDAAWSFVGARPV